MLRQDANVPNDPKRTPVEVKAEAARKETLASLSIGARYEWRVRPSFVRLPRRTEDAG